MSINQLSLDQGAMSISTTQFVILGVAAFALTGLLTWPVRALAFRLGAMDKPNLARKTQTEPVPYLGGVAIALGITIITFAAVFVGGNPNGENNGQLKDLALTVLLPALLLSMDKLITTKSFKEPYFEAYNEDSDIDWNSLPIEEENDKKIES